MSKKRIVVKVGSNVLTREDGKLDITRMSALVDQVAWLHALDYEVILVSSGAMASGRGEISVARRLDSVAQRQLYSALGQAKLINHDGNMNLVLLELTQQVVNLLCLGYEVRRTNQRLPAEILGFVQMRQQVLDIKNTPDIIEAVLIDGNTRVVVLHNTFQHIGK